MHVCMVPRRHAAGPPPPTHPPWYAPPPTPSQASRPSKQSHVIRVTVDVPHGMPPPSQASRLSKHRWGAGGITHNTWNHKTGNQRHGVRKDNPQHREPFPSPSTHEAMMLCTMTLMCYFQCGCWWYLCSYVALGVGTACSLLFSVETRAWLVMFLRKLYRPLSCQAKFHSLTVSLSTCLNDFHSRLLSKGPEESADGDHDHHLRHHHHQNIHHYHCFGAQSRSGVQWNCITSLAPNP